MGYYLIDNQKPTGPDYYTSRARPLVGIVVHCTAGLEDLDGEPDHSAEKTAHYAATTERDVSWHSGSDTDSVIELLPPHYTAWHCRGYNSSTYGHELSKRNMVWAGMPAWWVTATLEHPATHLRKIADDVGIPVRKITKTQLDAAISFGNPSMGGFIGHRELDPTRRTDPGADFPWDRFLDLIGDDMVDRDTKADDGLEVLADVFADALAKGIATEHTQPGGVAFNDEVLAVLHRLGLFTLAGDMAELRGRVDVLTAKGLPEREVVEIRRNV